MNEQYSTGVSYPAPSRRNYYADQNNQGDGLKYRLSGEDLVKDLVTDIKGAVRDEYGRIIRYDPELALVNELGAYRLRFLLASSLNKITHLTKYANEERVFRQAKELFKMLSFEITLNRKAWNVKDKDELQQAIENTMFNAMLRGNEGFENNNVSKSWNVNENVNTNPPASSSLFSLGSLFRRGGSNNG